MLKKSTLLFLLLLFILWIIFAAWLCKSRLCGIGAGAAAVSAVDEVKEKAPFALGAWNVRDGSAFSNSCNNHIGFLRGSEKHLTPLEGNSATCVNETVEYLKSHKDRSLNITGYYGSDETNPSDFFSNLGLARANNVKSYLAGLGVAASQMNIEGKLIPNAKWWKDNRLTKGIDFGFAAKGGSNDRIDDIRGRLVGKPLTVYFGVNQDNVALSAQQRSDMADIMYYLDNVASSKLDIGGHTDNVGNRSGNVALSQKRADFVRDYLSQRGNISNAKMNTQGFGPDNPIADNSTNDGKAKNRRVEIILR